MSRLSCVLLSIMLYLAHLSVHSPEYLCINRCLRIILWMIFILLKLSNFLTPFGLAEERIFEMGFAPNLKHFTNHRPKELYRLYEPLSALRALYEQIPDGEKPTLTEGRGMGIQQRRRDFVTAIAYLGAFKKDCDLAVAVRKGDGGKAVVTVAGSRDIDQDVIPFLVGLSAMLENISGPLDHDTKQSILSIFSDYVMEYHKDNIFECYRDMMKDTVSICLHLMTNESQKPGGMTANYAQITSSTKRHFHF